MGIARENIKFTYNYEDDEGRKLQVTSEFDNDSITTEQICEQFMDFIHSAGYSENRVKEYFAQ